MKDEYDFSKAERGKFYRPNAHLRLPVYLDDDIVELVEQYATRKQVDVQTAVNDILRKNSEALETH